MFFKIPEVISFHEMMDSEPIHTLEILFNKTCIGHASYQYKNGDSIVLHWLEINTGLQGKGIGSRCLDYFCQKAMSESKTLIVNAFNEEVLNDFYFQWFRKRVHCDSQNEDEVKNYFNCLIVNEESADFNQVYPVFMLKAEDITWRPGDLAKNIHKKIAEPVEHDEELYKKSL